MFRPSSRGSELNTWNSSQIVWRMNNFHGNYSRRYVKQTTKVEQTVSAQYKSTRYNKL